MSASVTSTPGPLHAWVVQAIAETDRASAVDRAAVLRAVRDATGVALAGADQASVRWALGQASGVGHRGGASIWATGQRVDRPTAALVNGTSVQALEFDDIAPALAAHLTSVILPTLAAFASEVDVDRAIDGFVTGLRVAAAVSDLIGFSAHSRGLQPTHTVGPLAAVVAASHALGLNPAQRSSAIGLAVTGSLGLRANTGVRAKALQSGLAAAAAVRAIELAVTSPAHAIGESVVDSVFALLGGDAEGLAAVVGSPLPAPAFLAVKPFPTSGAAHSSAEALLTIREQLGPAAVAERIEVRVPPRVLTAMSFVRPTIADEARWSIRYVLATAWEQGRVDVADFADEVVAATSTRRDPAWLVVEPDPTFDPRGEQAHVTVWADGSAIDASVEQRLGYPGRALDDGQVRAKFVRCLEAAGRAADADGLWELLGVAPFATLHETGS